MARVSRVVVGDDDAQPALLEITHDVLQFGHGPGIDSGEGLIEQDISRIHGQDSRDFYPPALPP